MTSVENQRLLREPLGKAKILSHHLNFLFFINITNLEKGYEALLHNSETLKVNPADDLTLKSYAQLETNVIKIQDILEKLRYRKPRKAKNKRGLVNGLGSIIKFISGNLDDNDLQIINANIGKLRVNQNSINTNIDRVTSFANQIFLRFANVTATLNQT